MGDQVNFPDIYIDESVGTGGVGSLADPYSDFSEINWSATGDNSITDYYAGTETASVTINLKDDEEWRETLTVGASGSATYPIIIQSYGGGTNDPIINGSNLVATWTEDSGTVTPSIAANADNAYIKETAESTHDGDGTKLYYGHLPEDVSQYYRFQLNVPQGATITTSYLTLTPSSNKADGAEGTVYAEDVDNASQIITFANWTTALGRTTTENVPWDFPALTQDSDVDSPSLNAVIKEIVDRGSWAANNYVNILLDESGGSSLLVDFHSNTGTTAAVLHVEYEATTIWKATLNTEPSAVWMDGTFGDIKGSVGALVNEYDWYWAANVLYVYSATDPDDAYDDPGIEASIRDEAIYSSGKDYITVEDISVKNTDEEGIVFASGDYIEVNGCTATETFNMGIQMYNTTNFTIDDCTVNHAARTLVESYQSGIAPTATSGNTTSGIIKNSTIYYVHGATGQGVTCSDSSGAGTLTVTTQNNEISYASDDGIKYYGGLNCIVENNYVHDCGWVITGGNQGISFYKTMTGLIVRYNIVTTQSDSGIGLNGTSGNIDGDFYYNILYGNNTDVGDAKGQFLSYQNAGTVNIYNNVIYGGGQHGLYIQDSAAVTAKNNIIMGHTGEDLFVDSDSTASTLDYNCYYRASGDIVDYGGDKYTVATFSTYQSEKTQDANSIASDPTFTDVAGADFTLLVGSPCINAGTDVSLTEDYAGNIVGALPDIGAYELIGAIALIPPMMSGDYYLALG